MKLSQLVQQAVDAKLEEIGPYQVNPLSMAHLRISAWAIILDELSEELFKLAGKGLPIQGQRRIAQALGIPSPEAPSDNFRDKPE